MMIRDKNRSAFGRFSGDKKRRFTPPKKTEKSLKKFISNV